MESMEKTDIAILEGACDLRAEARLKSPAWIAARIPRLSWRMASGLPCADPEAVKMNGAELPSPIAETEGLSYILKTERTSLSYRTFDNGREVNQ
ncbi:MAG: hypothetical protein BWY31_04029 [Lentisphaerae bacterium ADurb.Bin242]|nr:MAG: hypothetical protein BWY31_04029 [Lentisphaerae bacterium ADurb.Bin242]